MAIDGSVLHFLRRMKLKGHIFALYPFLMLLLSSCCWYSPAEEKLKSMKMLLRVEVPYPMSLSALAKPHI